MSNQPIEIVVDTDQPYEHGDHEPADQSTREASRDQPPTMPAMLSLDEAALALGIKVNAVRQRINRGTLAGTKTGNSWFVELSPTNHSTDQFAAPANSQPTIDLAPLVSHIASLEDQVQRLTEASTMWQIRARQAEEQLLQLQAGPVITNDTPDTPSDTPGSPLSHETRPTRRISWWRRLWES